MHRTLSRSFGVDTRSTALFTSQSTFTLQNASPSQAHRLKFSGAPFVLSSALAFALFGFLALPAQAKKAKAPKGAKTEVLYKASDRRALVLLAQAQTNTPAAQPEENAPPQEPNTGIPVGGDTNAPTTGDQPASGQNQAPSGNPADPATGDVPTPTTPVTPNIVTPDVTAPVAGGLNPTEAEGREIADVRVVGNRVVPAESILLQATTRRGAAFSARQVDIDRAKIDSLGFFGSVQFQVTPNIEDPNKVDLTFVVVENRVVTGFRFEGNTQVKAEDLTTGLEIKTGTVLNRNTINTDVTRIQNLYREKGFAALVTDVRQAEDGTVVFAIQEAKISKIEITGLRKTKESLIRRQITAEPGETFNQFKIRRDLNRIYDLGFFEDVTYNVTDDDNNPGTLVVTLVLKEKRTGQFTVGVGFDSRSKITGFLTLSENNLRGTGQRAFVSVEAGGQRTFDVGYGNPFLGRNNASFDVNVFNRRIYREPRAVGQIIRPTPGTPGTPSTQTFFYEEQRTGGRINYTRPLDPEKTKAILFGYRNEKANLFRTDTGGTYIPVNLPQQDTGRVSALSAGFVRDRRDLRLDPSRGGREQIIVERAVSLLGGDRNFTKVDLDLRRYLPLMGPQKIGDPPRLVLAGRVVVGKAFGNLPAFEQYFVGGSETVRGYDVDRQIGDNQFYTNLELRYRFQKKFQIVGFVDLGKATGGRYALEDDLLTSFGAGVRLQTPIGPIRLDIGRGNDGIRTHFAIGPTF
jgi:outer membrane protein insertion porin family